MGYSTGAKNVLSYIAWSILKPVSEETSSGVTRGLVDTGDTGGGTLILSRVIYGMSSRI
jgi:hypothetical protein